MKSEKEIRENIEDWEEIKQQALDTENVKTVMEANMVIGELEWVLGDD